MEATAWYMMYMPISGIEIFWPGLVLIGFAVGVIGGFFGMGGAWLVTPGLNILGFPMAFAIGTDIAHIAGKSMIATIRHAKFGNVDVPLGLSMLVFTMVGIEIGARIVMHLEAIGLVGPVVRWVYVGFLACIFLMVLTDILKKRKREKEVGISEEEKLKGGIDWASSLHKINIPPMMHFKQAGIYCSLWLPGIVGLITGVLAGFLGIGGGMLRMPALIYFVGCPTHVAVGTDLFEVMISGLYGAFTYTLKGRIELVAVVVMLCGAAIGAQIGTVATKYSRGMGIRFWFMVCILVCMISIILKQYGFVMVAGILILGVVALVCAIIMGIMFKGAAAELREKKAAEK
jgi:uncharacterized membrane protein YfcA